MSDLVPVDPADAIAEARAAVDRAKDSAVEAATGSELVLGRDDAVQTKQQLGAAFSLVTTERKAAMEKVAAAKAVLKAERDRMDEMLRAMNAELEPLLEMADRLADGISAVNLYLGRDEELEELRAGQSAPADTPLTIRQTVLAMDEESLLFADDPEQPFDFSDIDEFVKWLLLDDRHLAQVIPDQKGVVAIMARRTPVDYTGNPMVDDSKNKANLLTRWLLRNGERLYLMSTNFSVGTHLIPTRRSFTRLFEDRLTGKPLEPGSRQWINAEKAADEVTRHYMKVALILQGLVDRTAVFHPLPEGGLNLLGDPDYNAGKVVLIEEDEKAIGTGRQPFKDWQKERIARLEVGMRVIGYFPQWVSLGGSSRDHSLTTPQHASPPQRDVAHTITREDGGYFYFSYPRTDEVSRKDQWGNHIGWGPARTKASYSLEKGGWDPAFIPLDTVTIEEMEEYLGARTERHAYKTMFPALRAAIDFKRAELEAEAPFRALLAAQVGGEEAALELVQWYKTANKWFRPLNGTPAMEAKAMKAILAEHARRAKPVNADVLESIAARQPRALVIVRRTNDYVAVVPSVRRYPAASVPQNVFVHLHSFSLTGKWRSVEAWKTLTRAQVAKWTVLRETPEWADWRFNVVAGQHLGDLEIDTLVEDFRTWAEGLGRGRPAVIKYGEDVESGRYGAQLHAYFESQRGDEWGHAHKLVQPWIEKYVEIKAGKGSFNTKEKWTQTRDWRMEKSRRDGDGTWATGVEVPQPPHENNYHRESPATIVWTDPEVLAADLALAVPWADERLRDRRRSEKVNQMGSALEAGWKVYEAEQRRQRFIEDFGDASLWEDHAKSQKPTPFPMDTYRSGALEALAEALVDESIDPAGLTLEEVLGRLGRDIPGIVEALLPVTYPAPDTPAEEEDEDTE